jgi:hypothetical protein
MVRVSSIETRDQYGNTRTENYDSTGNLISTTRSNNSNSYFSPEQNYADTHSIPQKESVTPVYDNKGKIVGVHDEIRQQSYSTSATQEEIDNANKVNAAAKILNTPKPQPQEAMVYTPQPNQSFMPKPSDQLTPVQREPTNLIEALDIEANKLHEQGLKYQEDYNKNPSFWKYGGEFHELGAAGIGVGLGTYHFAQYLRNPYKAGKEIGLSIAKGDFVKNIAVSYNANPPKFIGDIGGQFLFSGLLTKGIKATNTELAGYKNPTSYIKDYSVGAEIGTPFKAEILETTPKGSIQLDFTGKPQTLSNNIGYIDLKPRMAIKEGLPSSSPLAKELNLVRKGSLAPLQNPDFEPIGYGIEKIRTDTSLGIKAENYKLAGQKIYAENSFGIKSSVLVVNNKPFVFNKQIGKYTEFNPAANLLKTEPEYSGFSGKMRELGNPPISYGTPKRHAILSTYSLSEGLEWAFKEKTLPKASSSFKGGFSDTSYNILKGGDLIGSDLLGKREAPLERFFQNRRGSSQILINPKETGIKPERIGELMDLAETRRISTVPKYSISALEPELMPGIKGGNANLRLMPFIKPSFKMDQTSASLFDNKTSIQNKQITQPKSILKGFTITTNKNILDTEQRLFNRTVSKDKLILGNELSLKPMLQNKTQSKQIFKNTSMTNNKNNRFFMPMMEKKEETKEFLTSNLFIEGKKKKKKTLSFKFMPYNSKKKALPPKADWLSLNLSDTKFGFSHNPKATKAVKLSFNKKYSENPISFRFPTQEQISRGRFL